MEAGAAEQGSVDGVGGLDLRSVGVGPTLTTAQLYRYGVKDVSGWE